MNKSTYNYYYGNEADQYTFYRLPKALFTNARFKKLSDGAKILYGLMLDRMGLSIKNNWLDEQNRVFIIFTLEDVQEFMNCKHDKAIKILAELDMEKGIGLIERVKQGQGKPAIIYVRKFFDITELLTSEKPKPAPRKNRSQDFGKTECNNTDINNNDYNDTENQSINRAEPPTIDMIDKKNERNIYREIVKENIEFENLCENFDQERVTEILNLIHETVCTSRKSVRINQEEISTAVVKSQFLKLNQCHIEYVFDCLKNNSTKIKNIKAYLLTALYNAPLTIDNHYSALVAYDMARR